MQAPDSPSKATFSAAYAQAAPQNDEMWAGPEGPRPHWGHFLHALDAMGGEELERRRQEARRLLRENGVTYSVYDEPGGFKRPWELDPLPMLLAGKEWAGIQAGLTQRAELLDLVLKDLYGPRRLLRQGLIPPELVYSHGGFLLPCHGSLHGSEHPLTLYAADLARGPDGRLWVVGDRTQAPSGAGYALENRTVMGRLLPGLFRDSQVRRLAAFFRSLRSNLSHIAPAHAEDPHVVILTPGPRNETYFEHAYLAAYLGYTLVQGDDLTVRDGRVWLKTLDGLRPVDVILRRVDDDYCDPLELREDSQLGVAGLLEAARRGNVAIANPLGSGVLENPGLLPFLPGLARRLLGQELRLPAAATWWCGQTKERGYVLKNLSRLVIKPIHRSPGSRAVFGGLLSKKELAQWHARIRARPHLYVGQEQVSFSTTPALVNGRLEPRHAILRAFLVASGGGYTVMPGGLTRIAPTSDSFVVSNQAGGLSKDTWVLGSEPEHHLSLWPSASAAITSQGPEGSLTSRAADNLYWVGRYSERTEGTARLLRIVLRKLAESREFGDPADKTCLDRLLTSLTHVTSTYPGFVGSGAAERLTEPEAELRAVALTVKRSGGIAASLQAMIQAAYSVRDRWSTDTWRVVDDMEEEWTQAATQRGPYALDDGLDRLLTALSAFAGLTIESMPRDQGWLFVHMGRHLERALLLANLLRANLSATSEQAVEGLIMEAVLAVQESLSAHRRRYRAALRTETVLEILLLDETNPRSLIYQLDRLQRYAEQLPRATEAHRLGVPQRLTLEAATRLRLADFAELAKVTGGARPALEQLLTDIAGLLSDASQALSDAYFAHAEAPRPLGLSTLTPNPAGAAP